MFDAAGADMALIHNVMIRGINSIYLQAPHIQPTDVIAFAQYCLEWHNLLTVHHTGEETTFFPAVEALAGEKGLMEGNVEQHHAFQDGLEEFGAYLTAVVEKKERFDGQRLVKIIDGFGKTLVQHLTEEIASLVELRRFGEEKMAGLLPAMDHEAQHNMVSFTLPFPFTNVQW